LKRGGKSNPSMIKILLDRKELNRYFSIK